MSVFYSEIPNKRTEWAAVCDAINWNVQFKTHWCASLVPAATNKWLFQNVHFSVPVGESSWDAQKNCCWFSMVGPKSQNIFALGTVCTIINNICA
jgi:hypothetical protein